MTKSRIVPLAALIAVTLVSGAHIAGQSRSSATLRADVDQRFDVLPLRNGIALRPHDTSRGVRSIEVTDGPIALDGQVVSGAELREKLAPADADLVLALSYLTDAERRGLFQSSSSSTPEPASAPAPAPAAVPAPAIAPPAGRESSGITIEGRGGKDNDGDRIRIGGSITVAEGEVVDGDVVAIGGPVTVDGDVRGDVVSVGGGVTLGPRASIAENVVVVGGRLSRDPGARVGGKVQTIDMGSLNMGSRLGRWLGSAEPPPIGRRARATRPGFALVRTLVRLAVLCLLAAAVVLFGQSYVQKSGDRAASQTVKAGAIGFLSQILFFPILVITIVMLVVTIVGIPLLLLLPFVFLGLAVVGLIGFTGIAQHIGAPVASRLGWSSDNIYLTTVTGVVAILSPIIVARLIGLTGATPIATAAGVCATIFEYLVWTVGFGAVALVRFGKRSEPPMTVEPIPAPAV